MFFTFFLPLFAGLFILTAGFFKKSVDAWKIAVFALFISLFKVFLMLLKSLETGKVFDKFLMPFLTLNNTPYAWRLHVDQAGLFLALFVLTACFLCVFFSRQYLDPQKQRINVVLMLFLSFSCLLCLSSKSMFQFFIGWELSSFLTYLLLETFHYKKAVRVAGIRFLVGQQISNFALLVVFYLFWQKTGTFALPPFDAQTVTFDLAYEKLILAIFVLSAISTKIFCFMGSFFISDLSQMPAPAFGFSIGAVFGSLGFYVLYKFFPFISNDYLVTLLLTFLGFLTVIFSLILAFGQTNIKAVIGFILRAQFGFVLISFAFLGASSALTHFIGLSIPVIGLFLGSASIIHEVQGQEDILQMGALQKQRPFLFYTVSLLCFACIGFPFMGVFSIWSSVLTILKSQNIGLFFLFIFAVFLMAFILGRFVYLVFIAPNKVPSQIILSMPPLPASMSFSVLVFSILGVFENAFFKGSFFDFWITLAVLFSSTGFIFGIKYHNDGKNVCFKFLFNLVSKSFYIPALFDFIFIKPFLWFSNRLWVFADMEVIERQEKLSNLVQRGAKYIHKTQTGSLSHVILWTFIGLFALILCLI